MINHRKYPISFTEVLKARSIVHNYLVPTYLTRYENLSLLLGAEIYVKHENHNPTGSFKVCGGIILMHHLKNSGIKSVITFSTGNHGLSIAQSAAWLGLEATIVVPENNNPVKNRSIKSTGATLVGAGGCYPPPAASIVLKTVNTNIEIFAVQAESSKAAFKSWKTGNVVSSSDSTFAGGLATGIAYDVLFEIYKSNLTDFVVLTEKEVYAGIALAGYYTHSFLEGAGSAAIMAAIKLKSQLKGKKVALQFSGCNASPDEINRAYSLPLFSEGWIGE